MEIYFLRHANAGEPKLNPARDEQRPLDDLGIEQSHAVGRALAALKVKLDAISTRAPTGTLTKNTQLQEITVTSRPPSTGPVAGAKSVGTIVNVETRSRS